MSTNKFLHLQFSNDNLILSAEFYTYVDQGQEVEPTPNNGKNPQASNYLTAIKAIIPHN